MKLTAESKVSFASDFLQIDRFKSAEADLQMLKIGG